MISQKKLEANRRNAQKSTGPKTAEGKAISSQNGLTHGLTSRKCPILPGENEEEYRELQDALTRDLKPRGAMQRELVEDLVQTRWKIRRNASSSPASPALADSCSKGRLIASASIGVR